MKKSFKKQKNSQINFIKIDENNQLKIDKILFSSNYPILFTCLDENNNLYICVCCQNNNIGKKWLLTKTDSETVIKMLQNEITIRDAFLSYPDFRISIFATKNNIDIEYNVESDWNENSIFLPKKGEYMESEIGEFDEELNAFSSVIQNKIKKIDLVKKNKNK